jgi:hypothetical protein
MCSVCAAMAIINNSDKEPIVTEVAISISVTQILLIVANYFSSTGKFNFFKQTSELKKIRKMGFKERLLCQT